MSKRMKKAIRWIVARIVRWTDETGMRMEDRGR